MSKIMMSVEVRPLSSGDEVQGACDDAACFLREVKTGKSLDGEGNLSPCERARSARWLAESALACALHFEELAQTLEPGDDDA